VPVASYVPAGSVAAHGAGPRRQPRRRPEAIPPACGLGPPGVLALGRGALGPGRPSVHAHASARWQGPSPRDSPLTRRAPQGASGPE
jgi:hypothetical protein